ncbi:MAG: ankyrin repeat domain-containing protein [Candidatus Babeliales bacterium]|jgi:ankyrin repeat protein
MEHFAQASRVVSCALFTLVFCSNSLFSMKRKAPCTPTIEENQTESDRRKKAEIAFFKGINTTDPNIDTLSKILNGWLDSIHADPAGALVEAIEQNKIELTKLILAKHPLAVNCQTAKAQETPLILAAKNNNLKILSLVIDTHCRIIELEAKQNIYDAWPRCPEELISECILPFHDITTTPRFRALINAQDSNGSTALMHAAKYNNYEMAEYLLAHGASASIKNNDSETAADLTTDSKLKELLEQPE